MSKPFGISDLGFGISSRRAGIALRMGSQSEPQRPIRNPKCEIRNRPPAGGGQAAQSAPAGPGRGEEAEADIPCRSANRAAWKYILLAAVFLAWLAFLIWVAVS